MYKKSLKLAAALVAVVVAVPFQTHAKVVEQESDAFVTRDTVVVTADPRATWLALTTPGKWWNKAHTFSGDAANMSLTPQADGCFCEIIPAEDTKASVGLAGSVRHMSVVLAIPDQALRMEGALGPLQSEPVKGVLTITLSEVDEGTRVTFEYAVGGYMRFEVPVIAKAVDAVMSQQLSGLAELLGPLEQPDDDKKKPEVVEKSDDEAPSDDDESADDGEKPADADEEEAADAKIEPKISVDEAFGDLVVDE